ncbi:MAG TPA: hypothetical protein VFU29_03510 [Chitinophagaceae bacterium]|nr:hypothetical protein [Chitinophagaceae bacterium]
MKKLEDLGKKLSKEEQKKIAGGNATCVLCSGGNVMCTSGDCVGEDYDGLYCISSSGNLTYYACVQP